VRAWMPAVTGGVLISVGAALPWLSFFAGLQSYSGLVGLYGRLLFAGGALAVAGGVALAHRSEWWLRAAVGALGVLLALFNVWLVVGLRSTTQGLASHPMLLARPGPGLFVALPGTLIVCATLVARKTR
jgi:hypothetical protein